MRGVISGDRITLRELDAELRTTDWGTGFVFTCLVFECPNPRCARGHSQVIPYADEAAHRVPWAFGSGNADEGRSVLVWQRVSGSTIGDITLAPSFVVPSCDGLHGWVRDGCWVFC